VADDVGHAARKKVEQVADQPRKIGASLASALGRKADRIADSIDENAPALANRVRETAGKVNRFAEELNGSNAPDLVRSTVSFGRAHPFAVMAGAALVGFAVGRLVGAGHVASRTHDGRAR
jgi:hypothetical protein